MTETSAYDTLTPREREVLTLIGEGDSLIEIAQKLHRSLKTIESHRLSLGRKLNATNRVELAKIAIAQGLVKLAGADAGGEGLRDAQAWIELINNEIDRATGRQLLERFCQATSKLPGVSIAAICTGDRSRRFEPKGVYHRVMMAISEEGVVGEPVKYHAFNTPCQQIIDEGECLMHRSVSEAFPEDPWLKQINADGYLGTQLKSSDGTPLGGVGLISRQPFESLEQLKRVIDFFSPRLAGALELCFEVEALQSKNDQLESERVGLSGITALGGEASSDAANALLAEVSDFVHPLAGAQFIRGFLDAMCHVFGLSHAGICRLDQAYAAQKLYSVVLRTPDGIADSVVYATEGTPCEKTLEQGYFYVADGVCSAFPLDDILRDAGLDNYLGVRLPSPDGKTAGLFWCAHLEPIEDPEAIRGATKYFAQRLGAELFNLRELEALMQDREQLEAELGRLSEQP